MAPYLFIFGLGYTAKLLAPEMVKQGFKIVGTSRNSGVKPYNNPNIEIIDFDDPSIKSYLEKATHLLISIPPLGSCPDLVLSKYSQLIKNQAPFLKWVGYLSSTGVYGDHQGKWVNEESDCIPHTSTGIARLKAELAWLTFAKNYLLPLHVFRLSGIYGPGRNVLQRLMLDKKQSIFKENQVFCRIHVEDIVSTLLASIQSPNPLSIYNVSDDEPAPTHAVDQHAASLLNREPPRLIPFSEARLSPMEQEFYANNRRVSNSKIKKELKVDLQYPSYREGLNQIWRNDFEHE